MSLPKTQRNNEIAKRAKKGWSHRKLSKHYNLHIKTIWEILQRESVGGRELSTVDR